MSCCKEFLEIFSIIVQRVFVLSALKILLCSVLRNNFFFNYSSVSTAEYFNNYTKFVNWHVTNNGVMSEQFRPGYNDQIFLVNDPGRYTGFEVRNIAANGFVWTGTGNNTRNHSPSLESLGLSGFSSENMCSIAFRLSYGKFN